MNVFNVNQVKFPDLILRGRWIEQPSVYFSKVKEMLLVPLSLFIKKWLLFLPLNLLVCCRKIIDPFKTMNKLDSGFISQNAFRFSCHELSSDYK
jgi:hypothetical protein